MMTGYPYPEVIVETLALFHDGDAAGANALWDRLMPLTAMDARPGLDVGGAQGDSQAAGADRPRDGARSGARD